MKNNEINLAIAEACGWKKQEEAWVWNINGIDFTYTEVLDWCHDLNSMNIAEEYLTAEEWSLYVDLLGDTVIECCHASSYQKAEAFLQVKGKWTNEN